MQKEHIFHLILVGILTILILSIKNRGEGGRGLLNGQNPLSVTKVIQIFVDIWVHPLKYLNNQHIYSKLHLVYLMYSYILKNSQTFTNPLHSIKSSFRKVRLFLLDTDLGL